MAIFKCKMCGGALEISNNETVVTCEYCGTQQTLPRLDDEKRANLYDRANHFRRNNEFDKAMGIYEQILNEDNSDSEAYWSLVLCRYGIEYVEDPSSHKRVPTVNRAQFTSIFDDDNYKSALKYADGYQKSIYEEEAKAINEIQKGILEISQKEEPFDVFICYKETDNNGRRTHDSVLANDLYHQLTAEGFKVFFAAITLEDKLGSAYEPYIFAALNSAKVMVVLGTKPEYFNAVWVKNEWSRYLGLIKSGADKMLIPAYKDMDPYDLPEEFSHLQAQDMAKLGFMQDLIRGIKKITATDEPKSTVVRETTVVSGGNADIAPLLKRAFMFLEDKDFKSANEYCEKVLDIDPENAEAYLGKLMAEEHVSKKEQLKDCEMPFDNSLNYEKVIRFGDDAVKAKLKGYIKFINERNELERKTDLYNEALSEMKAAGTESGFKNVAKKFEEIKGFQNADELINECLEKAEFARKDAIYTSAISLSANSVIPDIEKAITIFKTIPGHRDSEEKIAFCENKIAEINKADEERRIERERQEQLKKEQAEKDAKRMKKISIIVTSAICAISMLVILNQVAIQPAIKYFQDNAKYNQAVALMNEEKYSKAIVIFKSLKNFRDSNSKIQECDKGIEEKALADSYNTGIKHINDCNYADAFKELHSIGDYMDSKEKLHSIYDIYKSENIKNAKISLSIFLGEYEQDNNPSNGKEYIEWLVLDKQDNKILVISKYALDCKQYNTSNTDVTWETCSLRKWLNDDFINTAFSDDEKAMIPTVTVTADRNPEYGTFPGNVTEDKVFLLSITEANEYFNFNSARQCEPTDYAVANGAYVNSSNGNCWWWLRSPGDGQDIAASVRSDGGVLELGHDVSGGDDAVRPALWIDLNKI